MKIRRIEIFPARYPMTGHSKFFTGPHGSLGRAAIFIKMTKETGLVDWGQSVPIAKWSYETLETGSNPTAQAAFSTQPCAASTTSSGRKASYDIIAAASNTSWAT